MMDNFKISIVTCTYNRFKKIKKNIQSVKNQDFQNYEHFIIDDGSTDETKDYILGLNDKRIKYIRFEKNYGQPTVLFNSDIFNKITGDYIVFLDSDDYLFDKAFNFFFKYYAIYGKTVWNYAFDLSDQKNLLIDDNKEKNKIKIIKINSDECFRDYHPRNVEKKGYRDFLNFRSKLFYKQIKKYFTSPNLWYSSLYEVGLDTKFQELYIYKKIFFMSFSEDTVTRGYNIDKYKYHTLISKEKIFNKYNHKMDSLFFSYSLKSLIMNYLVNKNCKQKIVNLVKANISFFKKEILFSIIILLLFFLPHQFLIFLKSKFKYFKKRRY